LGNVILKLIIHGSFIGVGQFGSGGEATTEVVSEDSRHGKTSMGWDSNSLSYFPLR
jgi:hypothetical protein